MEDITRFREPLLEAFRYFSYFPGAREYDQFARERQLVSSFAIRKETGKTFEAIRMEMDLPDKHQAHRDECISALQQAALIYSEQITLSQYRTWYKEDPENRPSPGQVSRAAGTFNQAKIRAGLEPNYRNMERFMTREKCLEALEKAVACHGDMLTQKDYDIWRSEEDPSGRTIGNRFGTFQTAVEALLHKG
ncbi:hypothetical protein [Alteribacter natronophilus]|uniref:hypothetical protein n=1 Tax=Alteribacter natronophilus TaxID=2583810 RepID=UPI00110F4E23|nr:hypothetical protein [Alteribacter natronophilus]TMW71000.1 hypothetical protein FGB90_13585 [Alteribacter natronophilus]